MSASEEAEFVCPECGADIPSGAKSCPGCGVAFAWEGLEGAGEAPPPAAEEAPAPEEPEGTEGFVHGDAEGSGVGPVSVAEGGRAPPPEAPLHPGEGRLYEVTLSTLGVIFLFLTVVAVVATFVLMNWDVWISGASKEAVGPHQGLLIAAGFLGMVVGMMVTVFDVLRNRSGART